MWQTETGQNRNRSYARSFEAGTLFCMPFRLAKRTGNRKPPGTVKFSIVDGGSFIAYEARAEKNKTDDGSASWAVDLGPELGQAR